MKQTVEGVRWTIRDLEVLPVNEWIRYEVIDGELFVTRAPHRRHQQICGKIFQYLNIWSESTGLGETIINPGVIFSEADSVIPDVIWVIDTPTHDASLCAGILGSLTRLVKGRYYYQPR